MKHVAFIATRSLLTSVHLGLLLLVLITAPFLDCLLALAMVAALELLLDEIERLPQG